MSIITSHTMAKRRDWVLITFLLLCASRRALKLCYRKGEEKDRKKKGNVRGREEERKGRKFSGDWIRKYNQNQQWRKSEIVA